MHYKNRKPKPYKGCCWLCALMVYRGGCRHKRRRTMQETRFNDSADQQEKELKVRRGNRGSTDRG
jgi:hypothetical protein